MTFKPKYNVNFKFSQTSYGLISTTIIIIIIIIRIIIITENLTISIRGITVDSCSIVFKNRLCSL